MTNTNATLAGPRPDLFLTEASLSNALMRLDQVDPDAQMSEEEAEAFLAQYVNVSAVEAKRDDFALFVLEAEALVEAKTKLAATISAQARAIANGLDRMRTKAVSIMRAAGVEALQGELHVLKVKASPGSVDVVSKPDVPPDFWRVKEDLDLGRIARLVAIAEHYARALHEHEGIPESGIEASLDAADMIREARGLLESAKDERRAVDKMEVKRYWKEHGETRTKYDPETGEVLGDEPTVPGCRKQIDYSLVIK